MATLTDLAARVEDIAVSLAQLHAEQQRTLEAVRCAVEDEARTRQILYAARRTESYAAAYADPDPLVSICIPTYQRARELVERAIPSVLAQDHENVEVVVVGDTAGPEVVAAVLALGDPRVRFENLSLRGPYPTDRVGLWHVAGTGALNRAFELARGQWIGVLNDDDALRPNHVSSLLRCARESHAEVVYGDIYQHCPGDTPDVRHSAFPPQDQRFGWQSALTHGDLRFFEYELAAAVFGEPGDWHRFLRMMRAGVRVAHIDKIVVDYWPGLLWDGA